MTMFGKLLGFLMVLSVWAGPVVAADSPKASTKPAKKVSDAAVLEDLKKDWEAVRSEDEAVKEEMKAAKDQEQVLRDQIRKALEDGDKKKADELRNQLKKMHADNMKKFRAAKKESKENKKEFLEDARKSNKPPRGRGQYLESKIEPGTDARNRHIDRRDKWGSRSKDLEKRDKPSKLVDQADDRK